MGPADLGAELGDDFDAFAYVDGHSSGPHPVGNGFGNENLNGGMHGGMYGGTNNANGHGGFSNHLPPNTGCFAPHFNGPYNQQPFMQPAQPHGIGQPHTNGGMGMPAGPGHGGFSGMSGGMWQTNNVTPTQPGMPPAAHSGQGQKRGREDDETDKYDDEAGHAPNHHTHKKYRGN